MFENTVFGRLHQSVQKAIADLGWKEPTPIQREAIGPLVEGRDIIGCAQTGTGKTAAFMLPILNRLVSVRKPRRIGHPRALVLSPTRELAAQTAECVKAYSAHANLPFACVFGGVGQHGQVKDIQKGAETVIACPGRLIDLMTQGILYLDLVECFVLDEADRMLDMGFLPDIKRIMSKLPPKRQSMFFSATMGREVRRLAADLVANPVEITIAPEKPAVEKIDQKAMVVEKPFKDALLIHLLGKRRDWTRIIVFTKMRHGADRISKKLRREGIECAAIHSDKTQNQRTRALEGFRRGDVRVLVATDIASRGIDVPEVSCVVNMEPPLETENYVHRIGRTARAGGSGESLLFVTGAELPQLKAIERFVKKSIPIDRSHPFEGRAAGSIAGAHGGNGGAGAHGKPHGGGSAKARKDRARHGRKSNLGRRQPDFGQRRDTGGAEF